MLIRFGFDITIACAVPTPLLCRLAPEPGRLADLVDTPAVVLTPDVPVTVATDIHGNLCHRLVAPAGGLSVQVRGLIRDPGTPDRLVPEAREFAPQDVPVEALPWMLPSRYAESDLLSQFAWDMFGRLPPGWSRVQAVMDWVHTHLAFDYMQASVFRTAQGALAGGTGVCRDFAHLGLALLRALNIPARYVNGYLPDIDVPVTDAPMDFAAWIEVLLDTGDGAQWFTFDPRNNTRRTGRIVVARGRDATDVPLIHSFGPHVLTGFTVICDEQHPGALAA